MDTDDRAPWEEGWDKSLPFLSCNWLSWASNRRWHQFRNGDPTAFAVHKARKAVYRKCAHEVQVYEDAIVTRNAELRCLRSQVAKFEPLAMRAAELLEAAPDFYKGSIIQELAELAPNGASSQ
jgi:hypothetical protein